MLATPNSVPKGIPRHRADFVSKSLLKLSILQVLFTVFFAQHQLLADSSDSDDAKAKFAPMLEKAYTDTKAASLSTTNADEALWKFARACFDWADFNNSSAKKESIAEEGVKACRTILEKSPSSAEAHYYLAMNLGEIAETKTLGALKLVSQMETEFKTALDLKPDLDFSGPDRNLGLLYLEAPGWPASVGSNTKARQHLEQAVKRSPDYPENTLNLLEAELKWGNRNAASKLLSQLNTLWPKAQKSLSTPEWAPSWHDWETRREAARQKINTPPKTAASPHGASQKP